jgi:hypothetical protein
MVGTQFKKKKHAPFPPSPKGKKMSLFECMFNHLIGLYANSIPKTGHHHF